MEEHPGTTNSKARGCLCWRDSQELRGAQRSEAWLGSYGPGWGIWILLQVKGEGSVGIWARKIMSWLGFLKGNPGYLMEKKPSSIPASLPAYPFPQTVRDFQRCLCPISSTCLPSASCIIALASTFFSWVLIPTFMPGQWEYPRAMQGQDPLKKSWHPLKCPSVPSIPCCLGGKRTKIEICCECCDGSKSL